MFSARHHQPQDSMEKELSNSSGLTLGESPLHASSPRCSLFRRSKRSSDSVSRRSVTPDDRRPTRHLNEKSSSSSSGSRRLSLPHTITERHGGQELWVKAPVVSGSLEKRGFRWRRKWKSRYVELDGRQLAYYEDSGAFSATTATASGTRRNSKPKRKVMLTADAQLEDVDETTLSITPALDEKPWMLRARDVATKRRWLMALSDCIDILVWLRHYKLGAVLGVGGNGVVQKLEDERDGTVYAVKVLDVAKFRNREQVVAEVEILRNITNNIKHPNLIKIQKDRITIDEVLTHPWITRDVANRGDRAEDRDLSASMMTKLQRFNIDRKSQNMGSFMASLLLDDNEADFQMLVDEKTVEMMIRQLCVQGHNRIPLDGAHVIAKGLGLSPYIDEKSFVQFLDQDHDGFISASDFCAGVRALRNHHQSFATMVFWAMQKMYALDKKSEPNEATVLTREHFAVAFTILECPEPLVEVFFKYIDEEEEQNKSWAVNEAEFATLFTQFSFLGMLFLRTAKDNVMSMVKSHSVDGMPRISEDSFSST
ncbi:hypothetical protein PC119_g2502 [Phytophthora cactorum]|uniref:Uncharacterized protein n=1 Tax=Phytophthora cactorum TaxID=29920 RepID=A0A8T1EH70_9STRA|nr:hypothetical protein PC112_g2224 [Phytophthora cactorum]KAG2844726.1 hypothetical protein PC111_g1858 [Phytophthora cactorum]KAG2932188.1 hypothetical protein PC114_g1884 [Phytophthora cactorum]KAG2941932.1 hypothetical protein PC115_g1667 [Phytophthora cactorum]KAG2952769.1 hypothetical protein PC117_g2502 [Phytophthora cactorum]